MISRKAHGQTPPTPAVPPLRYFYSVRPVTAFLLEPKSPAIVPTGYPHTATPLRKMPSYALSAACMALALPLVASAPQNKIKNVVVLMEENRSFDHMLGWMKGLNGLTGKEYNLVNTKDPKSQKVYVGKTSPYIAPLDPDHGVPATTGKIYGNTEGVQPAGANETMSGFVQWEMDRMGHKNASSVMNMFTPDRLPVMSALVEEFAVFDRYFCSVPGPTTPNRLFQLMGTSLGDTMTGMPDDKTLLYTGRTIFDMFEEKGLDWKMYFADIPYEMLFIEKLLFSPSHVHTMEKFEKDAKEGTLPTFSWMNPRWFIDPLNMEGANDQHPDHDVRLGEALLKRVYETLRASPQWEETLLIVTYDEHGGFYDHVAPPTNIPIPDSSKSFPDKFLFNRGGIRIPTLLISPWVQKGTVIGKGEGPTPTSEYELTSVIGTMAKMFDLKGNLTKRDAWASTFEGQFKETSPRKDCPMKLPDAPRSLGAEHAKAEAALPINHLQEEIIGRTVGLRGPAPSSDKASMPKLQGEVSAWAKTIVEEIKAGKHVFNGKGKYGKKGKSGQ